MSLKRSSKVFQHLNLKDVQSSVERMAVGRNPQPLTREALSLLRNLRSAVDFVVLSSWPDRILFAIQRVWMRLDFWYFEWCISVSFV